MTVAVKSWSETTQIWYEIISSSPLPSLFPSLFPHRRIYGSRVIVKISDTLKCSECSVQMKHASGGNWRWNVISNSVRMIILVAQVQHVSPFSLSGLRQINGWHGFQKSVSCKKELVHGTKKAITARWRLKLQSKSTVGNDTGCRVTIVIIIVVQCRLVSQLVS